MLVPCPVPNQVLDHPILKDKRIDLSVKRLDLIHPDVSGNKFFKLKYNLIEAQKQEIKTILTFGGAYSNHIYACAKAAFKENIKSIGIIRGEEILPLNPTLKAVTGSGMELHYVNRESYRHKTEDSFIQDLQQKFGEFYLIPEGGTNSLAVQGTAEILKSEDKNFTHIALSIGTGGTFLGLANSISMNQVLLGFSSLKGNFIHEEIEQLLDKYGIVSAGTHKIFDNFHFGGYGKYTQELIEFIWWFYEQFRISLDPVYTGKLFFGIWNLIKNNFFPSGSKILVIHSGGLQGNAGFTERTGISLPDPST